MYQQPICPSNATSIPHMPITRCAEWDNCAHIYTSYKLTAINNVTKSIHTHALKITRICLEQICLPYYTYMSHCTSTVIYILILHYCTFSSKINNCNNYLPYYCKICARHKYAPEMPTICHMPKLPIIFTWGKYSNIYAIYELTGINHVTECCTQMTMLMMTLSTMTMPPNYISQGCHWPNQPKSNYT